jgi:structure-specific recognition protein 1
MNSSEEEQVAAGADRGSADEDDESVDEDFQEGSESDVAEEFDSAHESSGGSDNEADNAPAKPAKVSNGGRGLEERPKKKAKISK